MARGESHQFKSRCATCGVPDGEHPVREVVFNGQVLKVWDHRVCGHTLTDVEYVGSTRVERCHYCGMVLSE